MYEMRENQSFFNASLGLPLSGFGSCYAHCQILFCATSSVSNFDQHLRQLREFYNPHWAGTMDPSEYWSVPVGGNNIYC